jgi:hypothetical protein
LSRNLAIVSWAALLLWGLLPLASVLAQPDQIPIDYLAYARAADALAQGQSPYQTPAQDQAIWRLFHRVEADLLAAYARGEGPAAVQAGLTGPQQPGPYIYPPTLALLVWQIGLTPLLFVGGIVVAVLGFGLLWLRSTGAHSAWLWLIVASWDVLASANGGNVELILLSLTLLAAWALWHGRGILAAPPIALVLLIKPFYVLVFVAVALLWLVSDAPDRDRAGRGRGAASDRDAASHRGASAGHKAGPAREARLRTLVWAAALTLVLVGLEALRWGSSLRTETFEYLRHATDHLWLVRAPAEQTPMSAWNRTPLQALVSLGVPLGSAQIVSGGLWALTLGASLLAVRGRRLSFPLAFALALTLLYLGRPVGWGLIYVDLIVAPLLWPLLGRWWRVAMLGIVVVVGLTHWWALALALQGRGLPLLTIQPADFPWETMLVVPLAWLATLYAATAGRLASAHPTDLLSPPPPAIDPPA